MSESVSQSPFAEQICSGCHALAPLLPEEVIPEGWDWLFQNGKGWRLTCPTCLLAREGGGVVKTPAPDVHAVYRPVTGDVAVFIDDRSVPLTRAEAQAIWRALGSALRAAGHADALLAELPA